MQLTLAGQPGDSSYANLLEVYSHIMTPWLLRFVGDVETISSLAQLYPSVLESLLAYHTSAKDPRPSLIFEDTRMPEEGVLLNPLTPRILGCVRNVHISSDRFPYVCPA